MNPSNLPGAPEFSVRPGQGTVRLRAVVFIESPDSSGREIPLLVSQGGGEVIQALPRLVVAAFDSASKCLHTCRGLGAETRAGASCGDVSEENGLLHGLPVVAASRLKDRAGHGQILCARSLVALADLPASCFLDLGALALKGFPEPVATHELMRR